MSIYTHAVRCVEIAFLCLAGVIAGMGGLVVGVPVALVEHAFKKYRKANLMKHLITWLRSFFDKELDCGDSDIIREVIVDPNEECRDGWQWDIP